MKIITGKKKKALAILAYGEKGLGKTKFGTEFPSPIFIGPEENDEIDCARLEKIETWDQLVEQLKFIRDGKHDFKTLVIDTMDVLEDIAQRVVLKGQTGKTMATAFGGFGKAYEKMSDMFLDIRDKYIIPIRDVRGMNVLILSHAEKSKHEDPMTHTSYDTYSTSIHKTIKPIFEDWVSAIFFIQWELRKAEGDDGKAHAAGDGSRVIYTEQRPSHVAKNRFNLPFEFAYNETGTVKEIGSHIKAYYADAPKFVGVAKPVTDEPTENAEVDPQEELDKKIAQDEQSKNDELQEKLESSVKETFVPKKSDDKEFNQQCMAVDELYNKLEESVKPSVSTAIQRAISNRDMNELARIHRKMQTLTKKGK